MRRLEEAFYPNAYRLLEKAGFDPSEPSKLGKLPLEPVMRQSHEELGYKQTSNNYITVEDESANSNKRSSLFE